jgi:RNA polymerase sigma-70 factor (ECF subfamily)
MELALLAAIQLLPGRQRAVLILRDVLGWTGPEVAELLSSTLASVNSALQRARATIDTALPDRSYAPADPDERELVGRYIDVWREGDFDGLVALLREDAEIRMPPRPSIRGAMAVAAFLLGEAAHGDLRRIRFTATRASGRPAVIVHQRADDGTLVSHGVKVLEVADGRIVGYDAFIGPGYVAMFGP